VTVRRIKIRTTKKMGKREAFGAAVGITGVTDGIGVWTGEVIGSILFVS